MLMKHQQEIAGDILDVNHPVCHLLFPAGVSLTSSVSLAISCWRFINIQCATCYFLLMFH
jgi:hypothetical protein